MKVFLMGAYDRFFSSQPFIKSRLTQFLNFPSVILTNFSREDSDEDVDQFTFWKEGFLIDELLRY